MLGCYGLLTKEAWEAEQDYIDNVERKAWIASGASDLLPALEQRQRELRQQWPEQWERISALPSVQTWFAQTDKTRHKPQRIWVALSGVIGTCSSRLGKLFRLVHFRRNVSQASANRPSQR
jgi:hypothetical protein